MYRLPPRLARSTLLQGSHWLLMILVLWAPLWLAPEGCREIIPRGLYTSLRFTYYSESFAQLAEQLNRIHLDIVYPELGVFDPEAQTFTDFRRTFAVPATTFGVADGPNAPMAAHLKRLPHRLEQTFGSRTRHVAWIFLNRMPRERDGLAGRTMGPAAMGPQFDLKNAHHMRGLVEAARALQRWGFDGIQLDLEPFPAGDVLAMSRLLEGIRAATGKHFILSLFVPKFLPNGPSSTHPGFVWRQSTPYELLLPHCNQLVMPVYDFGPDATTTAGYRRLVRKVAEQTHAQLRPRRKLWFALPAFRLTPQHHAGETLAAAIDVLTQLGRKGPAGVAVFVYTGNQTGFQPESLRVQNRIEH